MCRCLINMFRTFGDPQKASLRKEKIVNLKPTSLGLITDFRKILTYNKTAARS